MKKLSKILILVLSLSLVCGLLAVFAFAEEPNTAARKEAIQDFNSITDVETWKVTANGSIKGTGSQLNFLLSGRTGYIEAFASTIDEGNNKAIVFRADGRANLDAYAYLQYDTKVGYNGDDAKITATSPENFANNSYYVWDVDIMAPTGKVLQDVYFKWNGQYQTSGKSNTFITYNAGGWYFGYNDTIGTYAYNSADSKTLYPISNDVTNWQHVTIILDIDVKADTTLYATNYLYIDGKYIASRGANLGGATTTYYKGVVAGSMNEIKIGFGNGSANTYNDLNGSLAIDNYRVRSYSTSYNGNLSSVLSDKTKSLTEWESNVYNESAMPAGLALIEINETKYDSFSAANAALEAMEYVEATMLSDVVDFTIPKSGKIYYTTAAQYEAIKPADGYGKIQKEDAGGTYAEIAPAAPKAVYYDYHWGDGCTDTHFLSATASIPIGEKLLSKLPTDVYTLDNGLIQGYLLQGGKYVSHTGWKYLNVEIDYDDDFNEVVVGVTEGETVALDAVATADMDIVYLKPVFTEVDASVLADALYAVSYNGTYTFYNKDKTLKDAITAAPAGSTLVLLDDVTYDPNTSGSIGVGKKLTLDLNGKTLDARCVKKILEDNNKNKPSTFNGIADFTITSSAPGAKIFAASTNVKSSTRSGPAFISLAANSKIAMTAAQPGYLSYYGSTPIQSYNAKVESVYIDGVNFYATLTDNTGYLQITNATTTTIKNSLFVGNHLCFIYISGRGPSGPDTRAMTATVDNCVFIGDGNIMSTSYDKLDITFTNCFLGMQLTASSVWASGGVSCNVGKATLGAGNYISDKITINEYVVLADGVQKYDVPSYFKTTVKTNEYKKVANYTTQNTHADDLLLFDKTYETKYAGYIGVTGLADVTVALKEGEATLGTATIKSGMIPSGVLGTEAEIENWVNVQKSWFADYTDEAVTADTALTDVTNAYTQAFDNTVYYQYRYTDHITLYTFAPVAPEGIEYKIAYYGTSSDTDRLTEDIFHIDEVEYIQLKGNWNGVKDFTNGVKLTLVYTYAGQDFTYSVTTSIVDYVQKVIANEGERYSEEDINYSIGLATYANAVLTYRGAANATLGEIATANADAIKLPEGFGETLYTATDLSAYVESISLAVFDGRVRLQVTMKDAAYTLSINDANGNPLTMNQVKSDGTPTAVWQSGDYYFYQLVGDLTITVSDDTNTVVAEGYTFSHYAAAVKTVDANAYALVCAMYEYGVAQKQLIAAHAN